MPSAFRICTPHNPATTIIRSEPLDEFLRRARKQSLALVPAEEVGPVAEEFRALLASLQLE